MEYPIAVFAYNRPKHLQACLDAIKESQQHGGFSFPVFIYCDAAKREQDIEKVQATIAVAQNWDQDKQVIIRERNYGFHNIVDGITEICDRYGQIIVIEDDILIAPDFLSFMQRGLTYYAHNPRVFGISGFMYFNSHPDDPTLHFQRHPFCWGWATWKRAWRYFEWNPTDWKKILQNKRTVRKINCFGMFPFAKMIEKAFTKAWDTWDCQWSFSVFKNNGLFLTPYQSLVWNCGCGGGTHGDRAKDEEVHLGAREHYIHGTLQREDFQKPRLPASYAFPKKVAWDLKACRYLGIALLKERILREKNKRVRRRLKLAYQHIRVLFTRRP